MKAALRESIMFLHIFLGFRKSFLVGRKKIFKFWEAKEIIFSSRKCEGGFSGVGSGAGKVLIPPRESTDPREFQRSANAFLAARVAQGRSFPTQHSSFTFSCFWQHLSLMFFPRLLAPRWKILNRKRVKRAEENSRDSASSQTPRWTWSFNARQHDSDNGGKLMGKLVRWMINFLLQTFESNRIERKLIRIWTTYTFSVPFLYDFFLLDSSILATAT